MLRCAPHGVRPTLEIPVFPLQPSPTGARPAPGRMRSAVLAAGVALSLSGGCTVRSYQPMSGLHRPVVVDPQLPNLADTRVDLHCIPRDLLNDERADRLCQRVAALLENQGAVVATHLGEGQLEDIELGPVPEDEAPRTALSVELRAREIHRSNRPLSWAACVITLTVLPGITESTFAQDLVIRDGSGFLLVTDTLQGRLVTRFGAGTWIGNAVADLWRDDAEKIGGDAASKDLSADLYRQISQIVFNARMHARVLEEAGPVGRAPKSPSPLPGLQ